MGQYIQTETRGRVVVAKLSNPPHALLSGAMTHELDTLVRQADTDENVGVVILTGTHPTRFLAQVVPPKSWTGLTSSYCGHDFENRLLA